MSRALLLGIVLAATACSDRSSAGAPAPGPAPSPGPASKPSRPSGPITLRDSNGAVKIALTLDGGTCTAKTPLVISETRTGDITKITGTPVAIERGPSGDQLVSGDQRVARVWRDPARPGHVDVVDPGGMAIVRIDAAGGNATLTDAAGRPTARVVFEGGRFVAKDANEAVLAYVQGGDAETAALLVAPLAPELTALAACDRLLAPVSP